MNPPGRRPDASEGAPAAERADALGELPREALAELAPAVRRAATLDPRALVRLRAAAGTAAALIRLPFGVLVSRAVTVAADHRPMDTTVAAAQLLAWLDGERDQPPAAADTQWRWAVPPATGWQRVETVPDTVIRPLVRAGALTLKEAAAREGVPGATPRAEAADALLDSVVLTAESEAGVRAELTLRALSALTRMGFLARGSSAHIDVNGRWTRLTGMYGSVLIERGGLGSIGPAPGASGAAATSRRADPGTL